MLKLKGKVTVGATDLGLTLDGPLGKKTTFTFSARQSYLQFLFSALGLPFLPTYWDYQTKVKHKINNKNEIVKNFARAYARLYLKQQEVVSKL